MAKTKKPAAGDAFPDDWSYEATLENIEAITRQLETGDLPLADVLDQFAAAVTSLQQCDQFLQTKQQQASLLIETLTGEGEGT
ncbi:MAG: exodeoxyribonuclease VII small subunit [Phormidesmis sp.]